MLAAFLLSLGVIFVAELGDKSQLIALAFATRFPAVPVLVGITIATASVHLVSVLVGVVLGAALPTTAIQVVAALAFFGFALWTLRGDKLEDDELEQVENTTRNAVVAASIAFFLAELGDKTMLATITLASRETGFWTLFGIWLGSTVGMVAADGLAIWVGKVLGARLPEKAVKYGAAFLFFLFGVLLLVEALS